MALMRWRWILIPVFGAAVIVALALPPRVPVGEGPIGSFFGQAYERWVPEDPTGNAVHNAVQVQRWRLRQERLADSIVRAARSPAALRSADGAVTVVYGRPLSRDSARVWLTAAAVELALYPKADSRGLPVIVALSSVPMRNQTGREERMLFNQAVLGLQAVAASSGACVVFVNLALPRREWYERGLVARDASGRPLGRFLDACALYGRFGLPGSAVSAWAGRGPSWYWGGYDRLSRRMQEARRTMRPDTVIAMWTYSTFWSGGVQWTPIACLRGGTETCLRVAGLGPVLTDPWWWSSRLTRGQILSWLLATRSPAQFAAFWRSPLPPAQALQAAYGEPAGRLAMSAYRHWTSAPEPGGPRSGARVVLVGIGWAALALALAHGAGRRWQSEI